jgi:hypothetical protein
MNISERFNQWRQGRQKPATSNVVEGTVEQAPQQPKTEKKPFDYMAAVEFVESSNNPKARAKTSSAAGLHQFLEGTWQEYTKKMGVNYTLDDRFDPEKSREVFNYFTNENARRLKETIGRDPTPTEKYLAHFFGVNGARKLLTATPNTPADKVATKRQLQANNAVFYEGDRVRTVAEVTDFFRTKLKKGAQK